MPKALPKKIYFPKVKEARAVLAAKALEVFEGYMRLIQEAHAAQEFKVAQEGYQFLLTHMPRGEGDGLIDSDVDNNPTGNNGPTGPTIQIGIALAPPKPKELAPVEVIDVTDNGTNPKDR
jgi:hypothetical protein